MVTMKKCSLGSMIALIIACCALARCVTKSSLLIHNLQIPFLAFVVVFSYLYMSKIEKQFLLPPGPSPWPFIGNLPQFLINKPRYKWLMNLMEEMNSGIACIRVGSVHIIPVSCPKIARNILVKQDAIFASREKTVATDFISHGMFSLFTSPGGDYWRKMKKVVASELVSPARLAWLHEKRVEEADNLVRYVYSRCVDGNGIVNIRKAARAYGGNVMRRLMFNKRYFGEGMRDGGPTAAEEEHVDAIFTGISLIFEFDLSNYLPSLGWLHFGGHVKRIKTAMEIVNKYHNPIIESRIREWKNEIYRNKNSAEDLLDILILLEDDNGNPLLSSLNIKSIISELFHAGIDNPSNAAEWVMAEMINNPQILQKAVREIEVVVGRDRLVDESDIPMLNYVKACVRESFRLHPVAHFNVPHMSTVDTTVDGYFIPKGSHVLLSRTGMGRNPETWDEPLAFKPERHLNESKNVELTEPDLRFISFSAGRRRCVGSVLGTTMTIILLGRLIQGFDWSIPPGETELDLSEQTDSPMLAKPLLAHAAPRLPAHLYPKAMN